MPMYSTPPKITPKPTPKLERKEEGVAVRRAANRVYMSVGVLNHSRRSLEKVIRNLAMLETILSKEETDKNQALLTHLSNCHKMLTERYKEELSDLVTIENSVEGMFKSKAEGADAKKS